MTLENVQRTLLKGNAKTQLDDDLKNLRTKGQQPALHKAVVLDVITDPDFLTEEERNAMALNVNNPELTEVLPINAIIARIVSNAGGVSANQNTILFPFFSSHLMMPISPGETVYVIYEDFYDKGTKIGYWFTRIGNQGTIEDTNYSHFDRRYDPSMNPGNYSTEEKARIDGGEGKTFAPPGFPNGFNTNETLTLGYDEDLEPDVPRAQAAPFEQIKRASKAYSLTTIEPVPRWRKRPQEFVIQGKNNALIFLGEDRSGAVDNADDARGQAGTIGMLVGRARKTPPAETGDETPELTNPRVIKNSRGDFETDKAPHRKGFARKQNPNEGNPDFANDAAFVYVSMQTEADRKMNIELNPAGSLSLPNVTGEGTFNRSHAVTKADHLRFVARKDTDFGVNGTILLVREGEADEDLGYFFIDDQGRIQIESRKVYLGKSVNEQEPYIKWTEFEKTVIALQAQINLLEEKLNSVLGTIGTAFASNLGNLGAPIPSLAGAAGGVGTDIPKQISEGLVPLKVAVVNATINAKSQKIFGE